MDFNVTRADRHGRIFGAFLGISILFYWKVVLTSQFSFLTGSEGVNQAYAWYQFIITTLRSGHWLVWDPFTQGGRSFVGEMQTGAFYPANFILALIPFDRAHLFSQSVYHCYVAVSHALAGYLTFRLVRQLGLSSFAGFIAGMAFSFGGMLQVGAGWPHLFHSAIWLPAVVEFLLKAWGETERRRIIKYASLSGIFLGLAILAGGLHFAMMNGIVVVSATVYFCVAKREERMKIALAGLVVLIVGVGFSAIQLLPSMEYTHHAIRFYTGGAQIASEKIPYANLESDHIQPYSFFFLLLSNGFNGNFGEGETLSFYIGVFPVLLAGLGLWSARKNAWCRYATGLILVAFLYSLGAITPIHGLAYVLIPKIWLAREAGRFMYLADFGLVCLAGYGADAIFNRTLEFKNPTRVVYCAAAVAGVAFIVPGFFSHLDLNPWVSLSLLLMLLSALLYRYVIAGNTGTWVKFLVIALVFFDLNSFDWSAVNKIDLANSKQTNEMDRLRSLRGAVEFLRSQSGPFRIDPAFDAAPNISDAYRIESTMGAGVTLVKDYDEIRGRTDLFNAKYILKPASATDIGPIWQDGSWKIYNNDAAYPRAWIVHEVFTEPNRVALLEKVNGREIDLKQVAVLDKSLPQALQAAIGPDAVTLDHYDPFRPEVVANASSRALLVFSENFYPGWRATVNGESVPIVKVDGGLRGVVIPAGQSKVSMQYRPLSGIAGGAISLATLFAVVIIMRRRV